jgi:F-type H+-transporting ATPase subunit gamma
MAKAREIRDRIRSVSNTMKITRTMEMVATVKAKQCQDRLRGALPYNHAIEGLVSRLVGELDSSDHPLFRKTDEISKVVLLALSSNRGFCGGYNTNIFQLAKAEAGKLREKGVDVEFHVSGKKAISYFRFQGWEMGRTFSHLDDKVAYADVDTLASEYIDRFVLGEVDEVRVLSFRYLGSSKQEPRVTRLLPFTAAVGPEDDQSLFFDFDPDPVVILEEIVPFAVKTSLFSMFLEAATSENIARRIAMKLATDNALDMVKDLKGIYNRARQEQITTELLDIMGGAAAIEA